VIVKVLVFAPHPDDDIIGCGGSILNHIAGGADVAIVYLTSGDAGGVHRSRPTIGAERENEAREAAEFLGITDLTFLRRPDGYLSSHDDVVGQLIEVVRRVRPQIAYLPHEHDGHPDHVATHRFVVRALAAAGGPCFPECESEPFLVETVLAYEVWTPIARPSYLEDTTVAHTKQLEALQRHRSQLELIPFEGFVEGLNTYRGALLGHARKAEAFEVLRLPSSSLSPTANPS
jgi:LmbE family N-acetylglucosaminyl deacetylase